MGLRFDQVLNQLRAIGDGARVELTPVSNQDDQVVSYARGFLDYHVHRKEHFLQPKRDGVCASCQRAIVR